MSKLKRIFVHTKGVALLGVIKAYGARGFAAKRPQRSGSKRGSLSLSPTNNGHQQQESLAHSFQGAKECGPARF